MFPYQILAFIIHGKTFKKSCKHNNLKYQVQCTTINIIV